MSYYRAKNQMFQEVDNNGENKGNPYLIEGTIYNSKPFDVKTVEYKLPRLRTKRRAKLEAHSLKYNL